MKVLVVSPFLPYPEKSGFRVRTMSILQSLDGHDVVLLAFREDGENLPKGVLDNLCRRIHVYPKPVLAPYRAALNCLSAKPLFTQRFRTGEAARTVDRIIESEKTDCVIAEGLLVGEYVRRRKGLFKVLDTHNIEFMRARGRLRTTRRPHRRKDPAV